MVVDSIARGHAIAERIADSPQCDSLFAIQDTPGMRQVADIATHPDGEPLNTRDVPGLVEFAKRNQVDLTIATSDDAIGAGVADAFAESNLGIFAPSAAAGRIETSKVFAKILARQLNIPTAPFVIATTRAQAHRFAQKQGYPVFAKQDQLAQGKGTERCDSPEALEGVLGRWASIGRFGSKLEVLIEGGLDGPELSIHA